MNEKKKVARVPPRPLRRQPKQPKQGLYYHSTPPKVIPATETKNPIERRYRKQNDKSNEVVFVVKPSNIRIWIHDKDIAKLTRVLWSGLGFRLLNETSTHVKVKKFLDNVPLVLNCVREIHQSVIENNSDQLQFLLELPPPAIITTKDQNGLTVAHKAAGLGHSEILDFIIKTWPQGAKEIDKTGKTPLHWAALNKDNVNAVTEMLMQNFGVEEDIMDYKLKTPAYYRTKPQELEKSLLLLLPMAPRIQRNQVVDWGLLEDDIGDLHGTRPSGKIVVEKKKKSIERDDQDIDPDLEESAKTIKKNLEKNKNVTEIIEKAAPISKILQNSKLPNGSIPIENPENSSHYIETPFHNGDLVNDSLIINGDDQNNHDDEIRSHERSPSPLPSSDTPAQLLEHTPTTIEQIDTPDIHEIQTPPPSSQMVQSDESLKENPETNTTNEEEHLLYTTTTSIFPITTSNLNTDDGSNENINTNQTNDENQLQSDILQDVDKENSDNNSDNVNKNSNLNDESTIEENDDRNESFKNEEGDKSLVNEGTEEEIKNEEINETNEEHKAENEFNDKDSEGENIKNVELKSEIEGTNDEENIQNEVQESGTIEMNEKDDIEIENEETKSETLQVNSTIESVNEEESNILKNDETVDENVKIEDEEKTLTNESDKIVNEENVDELNRNYDETNYINDIDLNKDAEIFDKISETHKNENNNTETQVASNEKPHDENEGSDDENSPHGSMEQLDYDGSPDGTNNTSFKSPSSPSTSNDIEGFIHGEPDDNQVQSQSTDINQNDEIKINEIIKAGDMEQLASIVLNGEGNKLLGAQSSQPEIQAFLDNVPSYMSKIKRVHQSARDGNLRELQAALDRRKFAIARDEISPKGATPLHVSTIFGHSGIVRYLAGRFPETTTIADEDGRTSLHYAATINDNGHFYNLLTHFGSNSKTADKLGNTPEDYKDHENKGNILSHKQLLKSFGANETFVTEMFKDQVPDDVHSARKFLDDEDVLTTLERCYKLIHESNLPNNNNNNNNGSATSLRLNVTNYLARFLKRSIFDKVKYRQTKLDHNLFDIIWPAMKKSSKEKTIDEDLNSGVVAPDFDVFVVFQEFFIPLIKDMHCLNLSQEFKPHSRLFYFPLIDGEKDEFINYDIDDTNKYISEVYIECTRNLDEFELPLNLNIGQIEHAERLLIEKILTTEFAKAIDEPEAGIYYTMNEVLESPSEIRYVLENSKLMISLLDSRDPQQEAESQATNGIFWPYGRGVFISHQGDLAAWINVQDHLRIIVGTPNSQPTNIGYAYSKIGRAITYLEDKIHFRESYFLGYLSSRPSFLGTSLKISTVLELPNLMKEMENLRHLCVVRGLYMIPTNEKENKCRVINMQSLGCSEWRLFQDYCTAVSNILQLEKDMSLTNSKQIAAMLIKIFRRKKNTVNNNND